MIGRNVPMPTCSVTKSMATPRCFELPQQLRCKVQTGGRRGDGARLGGKDGLIAVHVFLDHLAIANVGRQRNAADLGEQIGRIALLVWQDGPCAAVELSDEPERERVASVPGDYVNGLAGLQLAAGFAEDLPDAMLIGRQEQAGPAGPGPLAATDQASGYDLGVIENEAVARVENGRQIADITVVDGFLVPANDHQAGVAAAGQRMLGDQLAGQVVVVLLKF